MKRLISTQSLAAVAVALGALAAASSAHARSDVQFSIGVQVPGFYVQAAPVYVRPAPVYSYAPVHYGRFNDGMRHGGQQWQRRGAYGDLDHDGIANRYDRDRDGDGVSNRYDRLPDNPYRRQPSNQVQQWR